MGAFKVCKGKLSVREGPLCLICLHVHVVFCLYACLRQISPFYKDISHTVLLSPTLLIFTDYIVMTLFPKIRSHPEVPGVGLGYMNL